MPQDLSEQMAASELASLGAFARAVLARAHSNDPEIAGFRLDATVVSGEIDLDGEFQSSKGFPLGGFGL